MQNNYFNFTLSDTQAKVFSQLQDFVKNDSGKVFILKGYAGTGKTELMSGFIKWFIEYTKNLFDSIEEFEESLVRGEKTYLCLLASTGRAAKILKDKTAFESRTIHSEVYTLLPISILNNNNNVNQFYKSPIRIME